MLGTAGSEMDDESVAAVQQTIVDTGALASVEQEIADLLDAVLEALDALPDVPAAQQPLAATARFVSLRES